MLNQNENANENHLDQTEEKRPKPNDIENANNNNNKFIYCWGFGKYGQLGPKLINYAIDPLHVDMNLEEDDEVFSLCAGESHNTILTYNSSMYLFGKNSFGQLGLGHNNYISTPTLLNFQDNIKIIKVSLGGEHTLALSESNALFAWGANIFGQLGTGDFNQRYSPIEVELKQFADEERLNDISAGAQHSVVSSSHNRLFSCGFGKNGSLGQGLGSIDDVNVFTLIEHEALSSIKITKLASGLYHSGFVSNTDEFGIWGVGDVLKYSEITLFNMSQLLIETNKHDSSSSLTLTLTPSSTGHKLSCQIKDLKIGEDFIIILTKDNVAYSMGVNHHGQLGLGDYSNRVSISKIALSNIQQIEVGAQHVIAITFDQKIYGWGSNEYGQLSSIDSIKYPSPLYLDYLSQLKVTKLSCGSYHNIGLFNNFIDNHIDDKEHNDISENINLDVFRNKLNIATLSSTLRNDITPVIKKIKAFEKIKNSVLDLENASKAKDGILKELKDKEKELSKGDPSKYAEYTRGFENTFEINLKDIRFDANNEIGKGTFGEVKKGTWRGEVVAVKFLKISMISSEENIKAFVDECNMMRNLRHPNILLYMGACLKTPDFFVVTEYCENGNLFELLHMNKSFKLSWEDLRRFALEIAYGINYLHNFQPPILHRDLKSMNILLDKNYTVKIADFGNTKFLDSQMTRQKGTFQWMAPEVIRGSPYTEKSDVFSFGIIMSELATRVPPYQGTDKKEVARKVLANSNFRPSINKKLPKEWIDLMVKCYDQSEKKRPTFNEVIDTLKKIKLPNTLSHQK